MMYAQPYYYGANNYYPRQVPNSAVVAPPPPVAPHYSTAVLPPVDSVADQKGYDSYTMALFVAELAYDILYEYVPAINHQMIRKLASALDATRLPRSSVLLGMTYLYRRKRLCQLMHYGELQYVMSDERMIYLYVIVSLIIANKYNDDNTFTNRSWSNATGLPAEELNRYEKDWLLSCNYDLHFNLQFAKSEQPSSYKPWLTSISGFFSDDSYLRKDEIYGANDANKNLLQNGLLDYSAIESLLTNYNAHRSLRSPKRTSYYNPYSESNTSLNSATSNSTVGSYSNTPYSSSLNGAPYSNYGGNYNYTNYGYPNLNSNKSPYNYFRDSSKLQMAQQAPNTASNYFSTYRQNTNTNNNNSGNNAAIYDNTNTNNYTNNNRYDASLDEYRDYLVRGTAYDQRRFQDQYQQPQKYPVNRSRFYA